MRRAAYPAAVATVALTLVAGVADAGLGRRHRLFLPPPELPSSLAVDETEYTMRPSQLVVAAGDVTFHAYNRGMDDHNIAFVDSNGIAFVEPLKPGGSTTITADLAPGTYHVFCSLFAGTPESHEALGMHFELTVQ
jgi:plastocyanin